MKKARSPQRESISIRRGLKGEGNRAKAGQGAGGIIELAFHSGQALKTMQGKNHHNNEGTTRKKTGGKIGRWGT